MTDARQVLVLVVYLVVTAGIERVVGSLEQVCGFNDYMTHRAGMERLRFCGKSLTDLVEERCGGDMYMESDILMYYHTNARDRRAIQINREAAHAYLRRRQRSLDSGIVCECCVHHCSIHEIYEYCAYPIDWSKRRKRRSLQRHLHQSYERIWKEMTEQDTKHGETSRSSRDISRVNISQLTHSNNETEIKSKYPIKKSSAVRS